MPHLLISSSNTCMRQWKETHPDGTLSQFNAFWKLVPSQARAVCRVFVAMFELALTQSSDLVRHMGYLHRARCVTICYEPRQ